MARMKFAVTKYKKATSGSVAPAPMQATPQKETEPPCMVEYPSQGSGASASCANDDGNVVKGGTFENRQRLRADATGGQFCHTMKL
jgi:hypothetical protein